MLPDPTRERGWSFGETLPHGDHPAPAQLPGSPGDVARVAGVEHRFAEAGRLPRVLAGAVQAHLEDRVLVDGVRTVVF
jgi:hypothetical protein